MYACKNAHVRLYIWYAECIWSFDIHMDMEMHVCMYKYIYVCVCIDLDMRTNMIHKHDTCTYRLTHAQKHDTYRLAHAHKHDTYRLRHAHCHMNAHRHFLTRKFSSPCSKHIALHVGLGRSDAARLQVRKQCLLIYIYMYMYTCIHSMPRDCR